MKSLLPTPSHRAASAAEGQGSGGPVRRRRENDMLYESRVQFGLPSMARINN